MTLINKKVGEVTSDLVAYAGAAVGGLQRVRVDDAHVAEHNPSCRLLGAGQRKATVLEIEPILGILVEQEGEDLLPQVFLAPCFQWEKNSNRRP